MNRTNHSPDASPVVTVPQANRRGLPLAGFALALLALATSGVGCAAAKHKG